MLVEQFSNYLQIWYLTNKRDLPWRNCMDPYKIWLSEIILQQTRVNQGLPYYLKFVERFPTVQDLSIAEEEEILKLWQGLGYYSRARNLHAASKMVIEDFNGKFPSTYKDLIKLKGIGQYTASAIASFSSKEAVAVVDGNVYRVLSRVFGIFTPINSTEGIKEFQKLAETLLDPENPDIHNQAIMEFGALHCTPKKPNCMYCPFSKDCFAYQKGTIEVLPEKIKKTKIKTRYFNYLTIKNNNEILISKRSGKGIWQHLYEFPLIETEKEISEKKFLSSIQKDFHLNLSEIKSIHKNEKPHKLSHQHIYASFYDIELDAKAFGDMRTKFTPILKKDIGDYPVPVLIDNFLKLELL